MRLPAGTSFNPSIAPTLQLCSSAQFGGQGDPNVKCPAASLVGHVAFDNPLLGTVPGDVYFGREPGNPYMLYIIGQKSGVTVKIKAVVDPDDDTGQITTTFDNLPQVPFTKFNLSFIGGPRGVLVTPPSCGTYTGSITATPYSGGPSQTPTTQFQISDDQRGGCSPREAPTVSGDVDNHKALASPSLDLDVVRPADSRRPAKLDVALPTGLLGKINSDPAVLRLRRQRRHLRVQHADRDRDRPGRLRPAADHAQGQRLPRHRDRRPRSRGSGSTSPSGSARSTSASSRSATCSRSAGPTAACTSTRASPRRSRASRSACAS